VETERVRPTDGSTPRPSPIPSQRVVSITEAERLIGSGYQFVAPLGTDRAVLRAFPQGAAGHRAIP
jgi:hypothetical protein